MKIAIYLIIILTFFFQGCDKILGPEEKSDEYYLSVRIAYSLNGELYPLSGNMVSIISDKFNSGGYTDSNGWIIGNYSFQKSDFIELKIFNKSMSKSAKIGNISPSNYPEMFVKSKSEFKKNVPSKGYHIGTIGLTE